MILITVFRHSRKGHIDLLFSQDLGRYLFHQYVERPFVVSRPERRGVRRSAVVWRERLGRPSCTHFLSPDRLPTTIPRLPSTCQYRRNELSSYANILKLGDLHDKV